MPPPEQDEEAIRDEGRRITEEIKKRIGPQLQEMGVTGFMLAGYVEMGDGRKGRVLLVEDGGAPAVADGLGKIALAGAVWAGLITRMPPT